MRKILIIIFGGLVIIFLIFIGLSTLSNQLAISKVKKFSNNFGQELLAGNGADTYSLLTVSAQQSIDSNDWNEQATKLEDFFFDQHLTMQSMVKTGNGYTITYTINSFEGPYQWVINISKPNGALLVSQFVSSPVQQ